MSPSPIFKSHSLHSESTADRCYPHLRNACTATPRFISMTSLGTIAQPCGQVLEDETVNGNIHEDVGYATNLAHQQEKGVRSYIMSVHPGPPVFPGIPTTECDFNLQLPTNHFHLACSWLHLGNLKFKFSLKKKKKRKSPAGSHVVQTENGCPRRLPMLLAEGKSSRTLGCRSLVGIIGL